MCDVTLDTGFVETLDAGFVETLDAGEFTATIDTSSTLAFPEVCCCSYKLGDLFTSFTAFHTSCKTIPIADLIAR